MFLAIDEECATSTPRQCILCCDTPDYGEEDQEIKLKSFRMLVEKALSHLCALEVLRITPSEVHESKDWVLFSMPTVTILPFEGPRAGNGLYGVAKPAEARINKGRAINFNPKIFECAFNDERPAVYSKRPVKEDKDVSRWWEKGIRFHDNRSKKTKDRESSPGVGSSIRFDENAKDLSRRRGNRT